MKQASTTKDLIEEILDTCRISKDKRRRILQLVSRLEERLPKPRTPKAPLPKKKCFSCGCDLTGRKRCNTLGRTTCKACFDNVASTWW